MGYTSEFRAGRMIWRFRGSGGRDAKHTWPFQDAPRELKQSVLRLIVLRDNELPVLLSATENEIALLTTDRVARVSGADVEWADLADVVRVMHDIRAQWTAELMEKFSEPLGMQGTTALIHLAPQVRPLTSTQPGTRGQVLWLAECAQSGHCAEGRMQ